MDAQVLIGAQLCPARKFSAWRVEASCGGGLIEPDDSLIALVIVAPTQQLLLGHQVDAEAVLPPLPLLTSPVGQCYRCQGADNNGDDEVSDQMTLFHRPMLSDGPLQHKVGFCPQRD